MITWFLYLLDYVIMKGSMEKKILFFTMNWSKNYELIGTWAWY